MPGGRFAELNRGNDRPGLRVTRRLTVPQEAAIGRIAMRRMAASARKIRMNRARPVLESLEGRQLLSGISAHQAQGQSLASSSGVFSHKDTQFSYITPTGGHALIKVVGIGNLAGTTISSSGALQLEYGDTNAYSKIVGQVHGGGGRAPLASILNSILVENGLANSLSGVGGNPLASVKMQNFDLIAGGKINLTPGVTSLILDSIGPNTQVNLRTLPPAPSYRTLPAAAGNTAGGASGLFGVVATSSTSSTTTSAATGTVTGASSTTGTGVTGTGSTSGSIFSVTGPGSTVIPVVTGNSTLTGTFNLGTSSTLEAGQSASITSAQGITTSYNANPNSSQTLVAVSGGYSPQSNLLEPLATGQSLTEPPAPPGIILKTNSINGAPTTTVDLLTDSKIFGYDPKTGQLVRFNLNLATNTGTIDPTFAPIGVPGDPAVAGVNIAYNGNQLVVLVSSGPNVYAYNATTGAPAGSFTTTVPITSIASTESATVLGSAQTNELQLINLAASLQTGAEQPIGAAQPFVPQQEFTLLGGLTGVPGTTTLFATIAAHFNTLQPDLYQLGIQTIGVSQVNITNAATTLFNQFTAVSDTAIKSRGNYITVKPTPTVGQIGEALGNVDGSLALVTGVSNGTNTITLYNPSTLGSRGTLTLDDPDLITALSGNFRTDLTGSALVDIQGNVQSIRGGTVNGLVLNDTGNLALVKLNQISNSTVVGLPISHLEIKRRSNATFISSAREIGHRNGVQIVQPNIQQIGPLLQESSPSS
jgi:hypothetical protein